MALSVVQAASFSSVGTATTVSNGNGGLTATSAGNLIVVIAYQGVNNTSTLAISDSASQTGWQQVGGYVSTGGDRFAMFQFPNSASLTSVTATWSGSISATIPVTLYEISGAAPATPLDINGSNPATNTQTGTHTSFASSSGLSTSNTNDILLFGMGAGATLNSLTAAAGYTLLSGGHPVIIAARYATRLSAQQAPSPPLHLTMHPKQRIKPEFSLLLPILTKRHSNLTRMGGRFLCQCPV